MEHRPRREGAQESDAEPEPGVGIVTAHESCPGRTVFTESGNCDAWIATDLTLDPEP